MQGVALPVVLWTVAALSLLLGNLVQFARVELQMSTAQLMQLEADSLRMGAVRYVSQSLKLAVQVGDMPPLSGSLQIAEKSVQFDMINAAGLIDLNFADDQLLALLLQRVLNWTPERVFSAIELRRKLAPPAFAALRDAQRLMRLTPEEWAALMPYVTIHSGARGVNVYVAPVSVLDLLQPDNRRAVLAFEQARMKQGYMADLSLIGSPFHQAVSVPAFRLDVSATLTDGRSWPHRYWLTNAGQSRGGWRVADHQSLSGS